MDDDEPTLLHEQDLMLALLRLAAEGPSDVEGALARLLAMRRQAHEPPPDDPEDLRRRLKRAALALLQARALERDAKGTMRLTLRGRTLLAEAPQGVDESYLMRFEEFRDFIEATADRGRPDDPRAGAMAEGARAFATGRPHTANPYPFDSIDHLAWENGWFEARDEAARGA
jgi:hypothetical protein